MPSDSACTREQLATMHYSQGGPTPDATGWSWDMLPRVLRFGHGNFALHSVLNNPGWPDAGLLAVRDLCLCLCVRQAQPVS